jgi:hypothetical protein
MHSHMSGHCAGVVSQMQRVGEKKRWRGTGLLPRSAKQTLALCITWLANAALMLTHWYCNVKYSLALR